MNEPTLSDSDRTIFSVCPNCNKTGRGLKAPDYFSMAYTKKQWARKPKCDNCETEMEFKYEVKTDD
jgi:hypothetical protein